MCVWQHSSTMHFLLETTTTISAPCQMGKIQKPTPLLGGASCHPLLKPSLRGDHVRDNQKSAIGPSCLPACLLGKRDSFFQSLSLTHESSELLLLFLLIVSTFYSHPFLISFFSIHCFQLRCGSICRVCMILSEGVQQQAARSSCVIFLLSVFTAILSNDVNYGATILQRQITCKKSAI